MTSATLSTFRSRQSDYIAAAQRGSVEITSRGAGRRAVVVSPECFNRAMQALLDGPCQPGNLQLNCGDGEMRIRVAEYRVIYDVIVDELLVLGYGSAIGERSTADRQKDRRFGEL